MGMKELGEQIAREQHDKAAEVIARDDAERLWLNSLITQSEYNNLMGYQEELTDIQRLLNSR